MNSGTTHPYTIEVKASERRPGTFDWALRKHGKLLERSDREHRTEEDARKAGEKAIERQFADMHKTR